MSAPSLDMAEAAGDAAPDTALASPRGRGMLQEVTRQLQERTEELSALRKEQAALKAQLASSAAAAQNGTVSDASSPNADHAAALAAKDAELSTLRSRSHALITRVERLESEALAARKMGESAAARVEASKDEEILALKEMFTQISEKRKESFLQLKERLRQASEMLTKNQEQHAADARTIAALQAQLDESKLALREQQAQTEDYSKRVRDMESERGDLFQRTSAELQQAQVELREGKVRIEAMQREMDTKAAKLIQLTERESLQASTEMALEPEMGLSENGRAIRIAVGRELKDAPTQWYRSFRGSAWQRIPGEGQATSQSYTPTVDDIGATLKAEILVGPDANVPVFREIGPIGAKRAMVVSMADSMKKTEIVMTVDSAYGDGSAGAKDAKHKPQILLNKEKIKLRAAGKTIAKAEWSDQLRVTLDAESMIRFTVRVDASATPISYAAANAAERDLFVQTIRVYNQMQRLALSKNLPPDHVLALAYLIRSSNESNAMAALKREAAAAGGAGGAGGGSRRPSTSTVGSLPTGSGLGGAPPVLRKFSEDGFGFAAATGGGLGGGGSHPSTPRGGSSLKAANVLGITHDTPRSSAVSSGVVGGSMIASSPASSLFSPANAGHGAAAAPGRKAVDPAAPVAVAKIKGSNGEELEVDADGFVIRRETGWGDQLGGKDDKKKGGEDDDGFSASDDEEVEVKPTFQMRINPEARARPSVADLRKHSIADLAIGPKAHSADAMAAAVAQGKSARKALKAEKKEKKEKKKLKKDSTSGALSPFGEGDEGEEALSPGAPGGPQGSPSPSPEPSPSSSAVQGGDDHGLSLDPTAARTAPSPQAQVGGAGGHSASASQAPAGNDDIFAFLDAEAQSKAPPTLGSSPLPLSNSPPPRGSTPKFPPPPPPPEDADAAPAPPASASTPPLPPPPRPTVNVANLSPTPPKLNMSPPRLLATSIPGGAALSPPALAAASSSSSSSISSAAAPASSSSPHQSPSSPQHPQVDILVMETLHARVLDGEVIEYAVWGEILLNLAQSTPAPAGAAPLLFPFQLFNTDAMSKVAPNTAVLAPGAGGGAGHWVASIPAGTDGPLCVLKYKVNTDLAQAKRQVPLQARAKWQCSKESTVIDVDYSLTPEANTPLLDVKFLIAVTPDKCIRQCALAVPKCMWSPQSQKMMWQLPHLPALGTGASSGQLHAELVNADVAAQPAPLSVSFLSDDLEGVLSGVLVAEADIKPAGGQALPLGKLIYRIKSGIFTVL